jgi:hypothetical protein
MSRIGVALMAAALLVYLAVVVWLAVMFIQVGTPIGIGMGVGLLVLAPVGAWALIRELQFGFGADRLGRLLDAEGGMPPIEGELTPSGRIAKGEQDDIVARYTAAAVAAPEDWRAQYRLGVVLDAAGRRKDARSSIRAAIRAFRT